MSTAGSLGHWVVPRFGPPSVLQWQSFEDSSPPVPVDDQVLIRTHTAGISGVDDMMRSGTYPDPRVLALNFTPGQDCVGIIEALGPEVPPTRQLDVGQLVVSFCCLGGYATHIVLPAGEVIKLHADDDPAKMVALPLNYMTAYGLLTRGTGGILPRGNSILVGGASGGVGTAIAQIVRAFDMDITLLGTCSRSNYDYVRSLGVTPIDRHDTDVASRVKELTGGSGVDVAIDVVGTEESIQRSHQATKAGTGQVLVIAWMNAVAAGSQGESRTTSTASDTFSSLQAFLGSGVVPRAKFWAFRWDYYDTRREDYLADLEKMTQAVRKGRLEPVVGRVYRLSEAVEAHEALASGKGSRGKALFVADTELAKRYGL
ncbi:MAG: hypothetical protein M1817_004770 [Caeruleum heppii]|nr:MAG: hypothetical protein M1817_004770 [Caeruleum heppii]